MGRENDSEKEEEKKYSLSGMMGIVQIGIIRAFVCSVVALKCFQALVLVLVQVGWMDEAQNQMTENWCWVGCLWCCGPVTRLLVVCSVEAKVVVDGMDGYLSLWSGEWMID